jgi:pimeloyl-ACP methyl ester carboxylesterase
MDWHGAPINEEVVRLGPQGLVGVLTRPAGGEDDRAVAVFLNSGSEPHIGPGRAWVEYARGLAAAGHRALRVDYRGWGESPDGGHAPGRPYDAHTRQETVDLVRALCADGHERVVLVGLCASAWMALRVVREAPVGGVIALNPQMYWQPGDPVLSQPDTRVWRTQERLREERWSRWGLWTALDALGRRPPAGRWLDELAAARVPVLALFSEGDDGVEYLRTRLDRRLRRTLRTSMVYVEEVEGIDHGMHRAWLRPQMLRAMLGHLERVADAVPAGEPADAHAAA